MTLDCRRTLYQDLENTLYICFFRTRNIPISHRTTEINSTESVLLLLSHQEGNTVLDFNYLSACFTANSPTPY